MRAATILLDEVEGPVRTADSDHLQFPVLLKCSERESFVENHNRQQTLDVLHSASTSLHKRNVAGNACLYSLYC